MVLTIGHEPDRAKRIRKSQGATIRQLRKFSLMTITDLAEATGVTVGAVSQWETGRYTPRQEMQVAIAKALDVPWSSIFGLDKEAAA